MHSTLTSWIILLSLVTLVVCFVFEDEVDTFLNQILHTLGIKRASHKHNSKKH